MWPSPVFQQVAGATTSGAQRIRLLYQSVQGGGSGRWVGEGVRWGGMLFYKHSGNMVNRLMAGVVMVSGEDKQVRW